MSAEGYARIAEAFRLLASVEFPPGFLQELELLLVKAKIEHDKAGRARRASSLLAKEGATVAAEIERCCRKTVYNRAKRHRSEKV